MDDLVDDLKVEILCRLPVKLLAKFTCVSKAWRLLIINFCFPRMASKHVDYCGIVSSLRSSIYFPGVFYREEFFTWWEKLQLSKRFMRELLDSCNGLLLISHKGALKTQPTSPNLCRYFVVNFSTKQYAVITKPYPRTLRNKYAALAYDPSKSCHYKIVQFQGFRALNIFTSETGDWITLRYQFEKFEDHVAKAVWEKRSIYFKGALYRLSMSGHLIRFFVDQEIGVSARAKAIELPEVARTSTLGCVGINKGQILFSHCDKSNFRIWMLQHDCSRINNNYEWLLKCTVPYITFTSKYLEPVAFHPYDDVIILNSKDVVNIITEYNFGDTPVNKTRLIRSYCSGRPWQIWKFSLPNLRCKVPFAIGMADESVVSIPPHFHLSTFIFLSTLYFVCLQFKLMTNFNIYFLIRIFKIISTFSPTIYE